MKRGEMYHVQGPGKSGICRVDDVRPLSQLPAIRGAGDVAQARAILAERGVERIALLIFKEDGKKFAFFAMLRADGGVEDALGHQLEISLMRGARP
jgi:hypothetical protein